MKKNILVTGTHRSGSTWLGKMLSVTKEIDLMHEPLNPRIQSCHPMPTSVNFEHIGSDLQQRKSVKAYLEYFTQGSLSFAYRRAKNKKLRHKLSFLRQEIRKATRRNSRKLFKDPIALLAAEFFEQEMNCDIVISLRHPAAFALSLIDKKWTYDFSQFLCQEELMDEILPQFKQPILDLMKSPSRCDNILEQAILLWNILYGRIKQYQEEHPTWHLIKNEQLSLEPEKEFRALYKKLDLTFSPKVLETINKTTKSKTSDYLNRDSKKNITKWKHRLNSEEISRIYEGTRMVSAHFYGEDEWYDCV